MTASSFCYQFVREFEKFKPQVYLDAARLPTVGYGHRVRPGETFDYPLTLDEAEALLRLDVELAATAVERLTADIHGLVPRELDVLTSFAYNVGSGALKTSTLLSLLRSGDRLGAARQFRRWCHAGGRPVPGLRRRRVAEELWFLGGHPDSVLDIAKGDWT
jgi:lysozyme